MDAETFSRLILRQIGINIVSHQGVDVVRERPENLVVAAMAAYRSDPAFWDAHLDVALGPDRMTAEQAKVDGIVAEFKAKASKVRREIDVKGRQGR